VTSARLAVVLAGATLLFAAAAGARTDAAQKLRPSDEQGAGSFGYALAFSGDGNSLLVGGYKDSLGLGAAWVFTRESDGWKQQGEKLIAPDEKGTGWFGASVAMSGDGDTAVVGTDRKSVV